MFINVLVSFVYNAQAFQLSNLRSCSLSTAQSSLGKICKSSSVHCQSRHIHGLRYPLGMSLRPVPPEEVERILPITPTREQLAAFWGRTDQEKVSKCVEVGLIMFSGLWSCYFLSFQIGVAPTSLIGFFFAFYWLLAPNSEGIYRNRSLLRGSLAKATNGPGTHVALFSGRVVECKRGGRSLTSPPRSTFGIKVQDETGRMLKIKVNYMAAYAEMRRGMRCELLILARDGGRFETLSAMSDAYIPALDLWVGEYPYLNRAGFRRLVAQNYARERQQRRASLQQSSRNFNRGPVPMPDTFQAPRQPFRVPEQQYANDEVSWK